MDIRPSGKELLLLFFGTVLAIVYFRSIKNGLDFTQSDFTVFCLHHVKISF